MYTLAILYDDSLQPKPSNSLFIEYLINIASLRNIRCVLIKERHFDMLQQFDGLFIRVTTQRDHYTYAFAREAERLGLTVLDKPSDIFRCTSKILQRELFIKNKIEYPITKIISKTDSIGWGYPYIVKTPDTAFGEGVFKINDWNGYHKIVEPLFYKHTYLLMQEYLKTDFDWRIGILAGQPLFAIKYYIIPGDHRIVTHDQECDFDSVPLRDVPLDILELAMRASKIIGNGFYGVDIKVVVNYNYVIEVNDNPNIDRGIEDQHEGDVIYHKLLDYFSTDSVDKPVNN